MEIVITAPYTRITDTQSITLEQVIKRRIQRRRRVAKRMLKRWPLFAVQEMQSEFPGYTQEEFIEDVTRKGRMSKTFRRPKPRKFDWRTIRKEIPEFFDACKDRTPTTATLHGKLKDGTRFTCIIRSSWFDGQRQNRFDTYDLIKLWRGPLKTFLSHPAMIIYEHNDEIAAPQIVNPKS